MNQGDERKRTTDYVSKSMRRGRNWVVSLIQEEGKKKKEAQEKPAYCLSGLRQRGGVNLIQALVWNVGNYALMKREKLKQSNCESESTDAKHSDGLTHSSDEVSVIETERRSQIVQQD